MALASTGGMTLSNTLTAGGSLGATATGTLSASGPLTAGAGVGLGPFVIDYAFERFTEIGQVTHRVGIRFG